MGRQCGKSTLARDFCRDYFDVNLDEEDILLTALSAPSGFVKSLPEDVVLDEIQHAPALLRAIKVAVDKDRRPGRFVLTGSTNLLLLPQLSDSLAGRMKTLQLEPLSEAEKERQPGSFLHLFLEGKFKAEIIGEKNILLDYFQRGLLPKVIQNLLPEHLLEPDNGTVTISNRSSNMTSLPFQQSKILTNYGDF